MFLKMPRCINDESGRCSTDKTHVSFIGLKRGIVRSPAFHANGDRYFQIRYCATSLYEPMSINKMTAASPSLAFILHSNLQIPTLPIRNGSLKFTYHLLIRPS